jgi:hypothetical protein
MTVLITLFNMFNLKVGRFSFEVWQSEANSSVLAWWLGLVFGYGALNELRLLQLTYRALHKARKELNLAPPVASSGSKEAKKTRKPSKKSKNKCVCFKPAITCCSSLGKKLTSCGA